MRTPSTSKAPPAWTRSPPATRREDLISTQVETLNPSSTTYDVFGRPLTQTDPAGIVSKNVYDGLGHLTSQTSSFGTSSAATTTFTYNAAGLVATQDGPRTDVNDSQTYSYDLDGRLKTVTDPGTFLPDMTQTPPATTTTPMSVTATFDDAGEQIQVDQPMNTTQKLTRNWTYDVSGHQSSYTDAKGTTTYSYNTPGQLIQVSDPRPQNTYFGYDYLRTARLSIWAVGLHLIDRRSRYLPIDNASNMTQVLAPRRRSTCNMTRTGA